LLFHDLKGMTVTFKIDSRRVTNGTVIKIGIRFDPPPEQNLDATRGRANPKVYDHLLLKAGGLWYATGASAPQAAGWVAVERWLARDNRVVVYAEVVTGWTEIYREPKAAPEKADPEPGWDEFRETSFAA
jgi:hypothetical protein